MRANVIFETKQIRDLRIGDLFFGTIAIPDKERVDGIVARTAEQFEKGQTEPAVDADETRQLGWTGEFTNSPIVLVTRNAADFAFPGELDLYVVTVRFDGTKED